MCTCLASQVMSSSKRELYKARGRKGLAERSIRVQLKEAERKAGREILLNSKRKIAPPEVEKKEGETESVDDMPSKTVIFLSTKLFRVLN